MLKSQWSFLSPIRSVTIFFVLLAFTPLAFHYLSFESNDKAISNIISISFSCPSISPAAIEQSVTSIIENACANISGIQKISSTSTAHGGQLSLIFKKGVILAEKRFELAAIIRVLYKKLPDNISYPAISFDSDYSEEQKAALIYSIDGPFGLEQTQVLAEDLFGKAFQQAQGLADFSIQGAEGSTLVIAYDKYKLKALNVSIQQLLSQIEQDLNKTSSGYLTKIENANYFIKIKKNTADIASLGNIELMSEQNGNHIRLKDVATMTLRQNSPAKFYRINGRSAVAMSIYTKPGVNVVEFSNDFKRLMKETSKLMPPSYRLILQYEDIDFFKKQTKTTVIHMGLSFLILLVFISLVYRSISYVICTVMGLIMSLFITIILFSVLGIKTSLYSLSGITIAFGFIIDNTIVILDYFRKSGDRRVIKPLLSGTLIIISAALTVYFLPNSQAERLTDFAVVIMVCTLVSTLVAFLFTPSLYLLIGGYFTRSERKVKVFTRKSFRYLDKYYFVIDKLGKWRIVVGLSLILIFGIPLSLLPKKIAGDGMAINVYNSTIGSDFYQDKLKVKIEEWLGGSLDHFLKKMYDKNIVQEFKRTTLTINGALPKGVSVMKLNEILIYYEHFLGSVEGVDKYITKIGSAQQGQIVITFKREKNNLPLSLKNALVEMSTNWSGVRWSIVGVGQGFGNGASGELPHYLVSLKGYNLDELNNQIGRFVKLLKTNGRIENINDQVDLNSRIEDSEFKMRFNPQYAGSNAIDAAQAINVISGYFNETKFAATISLNNTLHPVLLEEKMSKQNYKSDILNNTIMLDSTRQVTLSRLGKMESVTLANNISREDRQYIKLVGFDYAGDPRIGNDYLDYITIQFGKGMPMGYTIANHQEEASQGTGWSKFCATLMLLALVFLICAIHFESLTKPLLVFLAIGCSFCGPFFAFGLGELNFDQGGIAAFILLTGLVSNSTILIIDYICYQQTLRNSMDNLLILHSILRRSKTIVITSVCTCCSLIPFVIGGPETAFWYSLSVGVISGMLYSMPVYLIILPAFLWKSKKAP